MEFNKAYHFLNILSQKTKDIKLGGAIVSVLAHMGIVLSKREPPFVYQVVEETSNYHDVTLFLLDSDANEFVDKKIKNIGDVEWTDKSSEHGVYKVCRINEMMYSIKMQHVEVHSNAYKIE